MARSKTYNIVVSYSLAKNGAAVFDDVAASSTRARRRIEQDAAAAGKAVEGALGKGAKAGGDALGKGFDDAIAKARKASREIENLFTRSAAAEAAAADRVAQARVRAEQRAFDEKLRLSQRAARERERENAAIQREGEALIRHEQRVAAAAERSAERKKTAGRQMMLDVASGTLNTTGRMVSAALSVGRQAAQGMGVDLSLSSLVGKGVALEALATDITNSAYIKGAKGPAGVYQDPKAVMGEVRSVADASALDSLDVGQGLMEFVKRTGDLRTGRDLARELATFAKGTATSFKDSASVAAEISNALGDVPDKSTAIMRAMRGLNAEGKLGAIEFSDLAKKFGKLSAASGKFAGEGATEGEQRVDAILKLGAMAQLARIGGGADSPAAALTAVSSFTNTLTKAARRKEFKAQGIEIEDSRGYFRNPLSVIKDSLLKTGGNQEAMNKLFMDVQAKRAVDLFAAEFRAAGGGQAGIDAINKRFEGIFSGAGMLDSADIETAADRAKGTKQSQGQLLTNQLERSVAAFAERFAPALEQATPAILELASSIGSFAGWMLENPKAAVAAGIGAAFGKELLGAALQRGLSAMVAGGLGGGGLMLGTAAVSIAAATIIYSAITEEKKKGGSTAVEQVAFNEKVLKSAEAEFSTTGTLSEESLRGLLFQRGEVAKEIERGSNISYTDVLFGDKTVKELGADQSFEAQMGFLTNQQKGMDALVAAVEENKLERGKLDGLAVRVLNMPAAPIMSSSDGREGISGHGG